VLILERPRKRKPPSQVERLHSDLPFGSFAHLLNSTYFASGDQKTGTYVAGNRPSGRGLSCSNDTWYEAATASEWPANAPQNYGEFTCVSVSYPSGIGTNTAQSIAGNSLAVSAEKGWWLAYENRSVVSSPNKIRLAITKSNPGQPLIDTYIGATLSSGQRVVVVWATNSDGLTAYVNGSGGTFSWAWPGSTSGDATRSLHVGRANHTSTLLPFAGLIECIAFIPQKFSSARARLASLDPYGVLFATRRIYIPTAAAAATAPTITALSAINITATSAQPQITYA
jgi:hypothetical protein